MPKCKKKETQNRTHYTGLVFIITTLTNLIFRSFTGLIVIAGIAMGAAIGAVIWKKEWTLSKENKVIE